MIPGLHQIKLKQKNITKTYTIKLKQAVISIIIQLCMDKINQMHTKYKQKTLKKCKVMQRDFPKFTSNTSFFNIGK